MNICRLFSLTTLAMLAALALQTSAGAAPLSVSPDSNQLYLVISNSPNAVFLTAYNTASNVTYQIETNTDITNPHGWGVWLTLLATNSATPLGSLSLDYKEIYFRAVKLPTTGTTPSPSSQPSQYLGRLDFITNSTQSKSNQSPASAQLSSNNLSDRNLPGWGRIVDPDGDCNFFMGRNGLVISVPGSGNPHDLAAEIHRTNAPRVIQEVEGDFSIQVQTDGRFEPGEISTQAWRKAYNGAALIVMLDPQNVVTLARAVFQSPGRKPAYYANFEMRSGGKLQRIGLTGDHGLPAKGPVFLRLERHGLEISGAISLDGAEWQSMGTKEITPEWSGKISAGVAAISTSEVEFDPHFSELKLVR